MENQILDGVNLAKEKTIKEHNSTINRALTELIDYVSKSTIDNSFSEFIFRKNLEILKSSYEMLEKKLLKSYESET